LTIIIIYKIFFIDWIVYYSYITVETNNPEIENEQADHQFDKFVKDVNITHPLEAIKENNPINDIKQHNGFDNIKFGNESEDPESFDLTHHDVTVRCANQIKNTNRNKDTNTKLTQIFILLWIDK